MGSPLIERAEHVLASIVRFLPEDPRYFFVSEYRDEDGNRSYESLWVMTASLMSEAEQFVTDDSFDITRVSFGLNRVLVEKEDFDFERAQESSRLKVDVKISNSGTGLIGEFKASGSNCLDLQQILNEYFVPFLVAAEPQAESG
jgi:hypothetical protein